MCRYTKKQRMKKIIRKWPGVSKNVNEENLRRAEQKTEMCRDKGSDVNTFSRKPIGDTAYCFGVG